MKIGKTKLICTFYNKNIFLCNTRLLQYVLKYGLFLEKVHKVTKVIQRNWLQPYISLNTTKCMADTKN